MNYIISLLLAHIQELNKQIFYLIKFIAKHIPLKDKDESLYSPKYNKLKVDKLPIIKTIEKKDYKVLIKDIEKERGKKFKPVKFRNGIATPAEVSCPFCDAPNYYIYDNNGGKGQYLCKVCSNTFTKQDYFLNPTSIHCPYCDSTLEVKKSRKVFFVHKCTNPKCPFYLNNLKQLSKEQKAEFKEHPERFKLHYLYREFKIDFFKVDLHSIPSNASSLMFKKFSPNIMGLCLTYLVNCGMSLRATSRVMREVHGIYISHTQISNYATTAAFCIKAFVDSYDYNPSNFLAADETYTKVKGKHRYVWFVMDAIKKSILGYFVSATRTVEPCVYALRLAFEKFKSFPGKALKFIADGYTAYPLARQQFALNNMDFDVTQVIGLQNSDEISKEHRWLKQVIERLNRTFKFSYKTSNGYGSDDGSSTYLVLFVAYYNFLRPHTYTHWKPLNIVPELENVELMPAKWQVLIQLSQKLILSKQSE